jgi:hypothetical protein
MKTKSFGDVARPHFEVTGWEDAQDVAPDFSKPNGGGDKMSLAKEFDDQVPF